MNKRSFFLVLLLFPLVLFAAEGDEEEEEVVFQEEELIAAVGDLGPTASGFSSEGDFGPEDENFIDPRVLRDFIESRGLIECRQKEGNLTIAGDVRARWVIANEEVAGNRVRGSRPPLVAMNRFKSEVNLFLDYVAPRAWVSTKLKWVNFDGKDGGTATRPEMDRAFIGYDLYKQDSEDFYIEVGRSQLSLIFESRVEFTSTFDGIHIYYTRCWPTVGTLTVHGGPFIVDSFTNHYAWIVEAGITGWRGTGLGFQYTIIDWARHAPTLDYGNLPASGDDTVIGNPRYSFIVSQMLFGYERKIDFLHCKTFYLYAAVLANSDAKRTRTTNGKKLNGAWYTGFTLGKLCKACDWSIDIIYQSVQAQAVPEFDLSGIGHGNADNTLLSDAILSGIAPGNARGFTNYKGWQFNLLYALTDSMSFRSKAEFSTPRNESIGGSFNYKSVEMSLIYAF